MTETTEAPPTEQSEAAVAAFRRALDGQISVSAAIVQDGLLDIWGSLPEGDKRSGIEHWLSETLERSLYAVKDVDARLSSLLADAGTPAN